MSDIKERLRSMELTVCKDAADHIEQQEAEMAKLRKRTRQPFGDECSGPSRRTPECAAVRIRVNRGQFSDCHSTARSTEMSLVSRIETRVESVTVHIAFPASLQLTMAAGQLCVHDLRGYDDEEIRDHGKRDRVGNQPCVSGDCRGTHRKQRVQPDRNARDSGGDLFVLWTRGLQQRRRYPGRHPDTARVRRDH